MYRFFRGIPQALIESAELDGAGSFRIFWSIGLPLGAGGVMSAVVLGFLDCWNLIEPPMTYLKTKALWPLSLYLPQVVTAARVWRWPPRWWRSSRRSSSSSTGRATLNRELLPRA